VTVYTIQNKNVESKFAVFVVIIYRQSFVE